MDGCTVQTMGQTTRRQSRWHRDRSLFLPGIKITRVKDHDLLWQKHVINIVIWIWLYTDGSQNQAGCTVMKEDISDTETWAHLSSQQQQCLGWLTDWLTVCLSDRLIGWLAFAQLPDALTNNYPWRQHHICLINYTRLPQQQVVSSDKTESLGLCMRVR